MSRYVWIAIAVQFVASTIPSASKLVVSTFAVEPYIALRWSISALVFGCILIVSNARSSWDPHLIAKVSALGVGGYVLASLGTLYAVKLAGVSFFALLTLLSPLIVVALSPVVLKERISRSTRIALGIALGGLALIVGGRVEVLSMRSAALATVLVIAAYTSESLTFLCSKPFQSRLSLVQYLFVAQTAAAASMWLASFAMYPREQLVPPTGGIWAAIAYVALVSCVGIYFVWYWLLEHLQGQQLGVLQYFHGISAALLGVVFFDEALSRPMIAGSALLLLSIVIASRHESEARETLVLDMQEAHGTLQASVGEERRRLLDSISLEVSAKDEMLLAGQAKHYLSVGLSAIECIEEAVQAAGIAAPLSILDLPCGHGRVLRYLKAAFPEAEITCADTNRDGVAFCAQTFGAIPYLSHADLGTVRLPRRYDLIWCGSLLTHLPERHAIDLFQLFSEHLAPNGLCVFSTHGDGAIDRLTNRIFSYGLDDGQRTELLRQVGSSGYAFCELQRDYGIAFTSSETIRAMANRVGGWSEAYFRTRGWDDHQDVFAFKSNGLPGVLTRVRRTARWFGRRVHPARLTGRR